MRKFYLFLGVFLVAMLSTNEIFAQEAAAAAANTADAGAFQTLKILH